MRMQAGSKAALFTVLDVVPIHVQQTFDLDEDGHFKHPSTMMSVGVGDTIPDKLDFAIILYNVSSWHVQKAEELAQQLEQLDSRTFIYMIPVVQDAAPVNAVGDKFIIPTLPPASATAPPIYWPNPLVPFETKPYGYFDLDDWHLFVQQETTKGTAPAKIIFNSDKRDGTYTVTWHEPGDGTVEDVRVYDHVLTQDEVACGYSSVCEPLPTTYNDNVWDM